MDPATPHSPPSTGTAPHLAARLTADCRRTRPRAHHRARHRGRRTARAVLPAVIRVTASAAATALVWAAGHRWLSNGSGGRDGSDGVEMASPGTFLTIGAAVLVVLSAMAVRARTGSRLAAVVASIAFPLAALSLVLIAGLG